MKPLAEHVWMNGEVKPWAECTVHVLTHALHYGTSVFEGIRVYDTPKGPAVFRLTDHIRRFFDSARIYGFQPPYPEAEIIEACKAITARNRLRSAYVRPVAFLGECGMGVIPKTDRAPVDTAIAAFPWGAYLGEEGLEKGVDVCVSSWARLAPNTIPAAAKAGGNYLSSYLIGREARDRGFAEGIGLGTDGRLSEGAGENLFIVKDGKLMTPPAASSILQGITRDTILRRPRADHQADAGGFPRPFQGCDGRPLGLARVRGGRGRNLCGTHEGHGAGGLTGSSAPGSDLILSLSKDEAGPTAEDRSPSPQLSMTSEKMSVIR